MSGISLRCARWIVERFTPEQDREALAGDLLEEHALRERSSSASEASRWCWRQVSASVLHLLCASLRRGAWLITLSVAAGAYVVVGVLERVTSAVVSRALRLDSDGYTLFDLLLAVPIVILVACVAARLRRGSAGTLASIMLIIAAVLLARNDEGLPLWQQLAFLTVGPSASLAGGALSTKRLRGAR
jgi:hypothetical protein